MASYHQYETAHGKMWLVRFRIINGDGKLVNKSLRNFKTKKTAEQAYRDFMESYTPPKYTADGKLEMTFGKLCEEYITYSESMQKESSVYEIRTRINNHLLPTFGNKPISSLQATDLLNWQNSLAEYSQSYKVILRRLFNTIMIYGNKYHNVDKSVISVVDMPKSPNAKEKEMQVWTPDEYRQFMSALDNEIYSTFFEFLYLSGCRKGEALALMVGDVFDGYVKISKSVTRKVDDAPYKITSPKNPQSVRTIALPIPLTDKLKRLASLSQGEFVFHGTRPIPDRTIDRVFADAIKQSKVKRIRMHDIRHSHASLLISNGVELYARFSPKSCLPSPTGLGTFDCRQKLRVLFGGPALRSSLTFRPASKVLLKYLKSCLTWLF